MAKKTAKAAVAATETTATKTAAKRAPAAKPEVFLQYAGKDINTEAIVAAAKAEFKAEKGRIGIKTCQVYLKPEDNAAYYVINGDFTGKIEL